MRTASTQKQHKYDSCQCIFFCFFVFFRSQSDQKSKMENESMIRFAADVFVSTQLNCGTLMSAKQLFFFFGICTQIKQREFDACRRHTTTVHKTSASANDVRHKSILTVKFIPIQFLLTILFECYFNFPFNDWNCDFVFFVFLFF